MTQAQLALADGDKATANRLRKELVELNLKIEESTKWMLEVENLVKRTTVTDDWKAKHAASLEAFEKGDIKTAVKIWREVREREQQTRRNVKYGCTNSEPNPFEKRETRGNPHAAPWWIGQDGYEELTARWLELDSAGRAEIGEIEADTATDSKKANRSEAAAQASCSCGDRCWVRVVGEKMDKSYPEDALTKEERVAKERAEESERDHRDLASKIRRFLKCLEYRVNCGEVLDEKIEKCLKEILALAKGKTRHDKPRESDSTEECNTNGPDGNILEHLRLYCGWTRRVLRLEVDDQIVDLARRLVNRTHQDDIENPEVGQVPSLSNVQAGEDSGGTVYCYLEDFQRPGK